MSRFQWLCFSISLLFSFKNVHSFNCTSEQTLCSVCKEFGTNDGVNTFYADSLCSIYLEISDANMTNEEIPIKCEQLFNRFTNSSCQLAVIPDVDILGSYLVYGIRSTNHSMLLGLERENCTKTWNWYSRLTNDTFLAGIGDASESCEISQGAFIGYELVRIDPTDFYPTGVLCQCSEYLSY
ncbi:unnamed protein product [Caenorhabditis angaria]|uniref:DUF281 domain-containing protein n=1 Tax=Caenorhabditis angaria TaxID=860376 RepID=A0A9P1J573_9PELO|nr:unnamed protein product [Caenorhabditis angaria]